MMTKEESRREYLIAYWMKQEITLKRMSDDDKRRVKELTEKMNKILSGILGY